jgi:dihydroxyacetone kinase
LCIMCCYNGRILKLHVSKVIKFYLSFIQNYLLVVGDCLAAKTSRTNTQQRRRVALCVWAHFFRNTSDGRKYLTIIKLP